MATETDVSQAVRLGAVGCVGVGVGGGWVCGCVCGGGIVGGGVFFFLGGYILQ